jgi:hypothetical protein
MFRDTYRVLTTNAVKSYNKVPRYESYPGITWTSWMGETGMLPCFSYDVISKSLYPPASYLKALKMLLSMNCDSCGVMTAEASPLTLTRLCKKCSTRCDEAICTTASGAKELCLLTDKDLIGIHCYESSTDDTAGMPFCPKAFYSAQGVANKCLSKYGGLVAFKEEVEKRRLKARQKYDDSQTSDKPQKKRSKILHTSFFNGDIKNFTRLFGNTMVCGMVTWNANKGLMMFYRCPEYFLVNAPCMFQDGISGDFIGTKFAILMQSTNTVRKISPTEDMAVAVSSNIQLVDLLATAIDIVFCENHPRGPMNRATIHTGRFSLKSANCGGEDCVKVMVVNDTRYIDDGQFEVDEGVGGLFCLVAQVNGSRPVIFCAQGYGGYDDLGDASMGQMQSVLNKLGLSSCNPKEFAAAVILLFRGLVADTELHPLLAPFAKMMALGQYIENIFSNNLPTMREIGQVLVDDWVVVEGEGELFYGDY